MAEPTAPARLLVVDDNEANRDVLARRLSRRGFAVSTAADGEEALALIEQEAFDLVLLDWMMPKLSGLEVLRRLRQAPETAKLPVIMVTARDQGEEVAQALDQGADDYVTKPVDLKVLLARIQVQLARRRTERELKQAYQRMERMALYDSLTGLYNRHHLDQRLSHELERAHRYGHPLTVLMIDLDGFKQVNDQLGHLKGDEVLQAVGRLMRETLRETDLAFRYGGDEFLVLLVETNGEAVHVVARLQEGFQEWLARSGLKAQLDRLRQQGRIEKPLRLSIGQFSWVPGMERDPQDVLKEADRLLYEEKQGQDVHRLQRQLSQASHRLRLQGAFLDSISERIVVTDLKGKVIYANRVFTRWCGCPLEALSDRDLAQAVPAFAPVLEAARRDQKEPLKLTLSEAETLLITRSVLKNARGTPFAHVFVGTDITALERATQRLRQTQQFLERLNAEARLEPILQLLLEETIALIPHADSGSALLLNEDTGELEFVAAVGWDLEALRAIRFKPEMNIQRVLYGDEPAIITEDLAAFQREHWDAENVKQMRKIGLPKSFLSVPIRLEGRVVGYFNLNNKQRARAFTAEDLELASSMLSQIELTVQRARERRALELHQQRLKQAFQLGQELAQLDTVEAVTQHAARWAAEQYGYDLVGVALREGDRHVVVAFVGSETAHSKVGQQFHGKASLVSWVIERRRAVCVNDVRKDPRYHELDPRTRSELVVPIALGDEVLGALNLESYRLNAFSKADCELASFLAGQLAVAISNLRRERALQRAHRRYQALFEGAPDGITLLDSQGHHVDANPRMLELLGYSREEFLKMSFREVVAPEDQVDSARRLKRMRRGKRFSEPYRKHVRHKDGTRIPVEFTVAPVFDDAGQLQYVISIARDLREKERLERALRESEQRYRTLVEKSLVGVYLLQGDRTLYLNPRAEEILGYTLAQVQREGYLHCVHPEDRERVAEQVRRRIEGKATTAHYRYRIVRKDGQVIHVEVLGTRIEYGGKPAILGTLIDVSERVRAEAERERLLAAEREQRLLAETLHEAALALSAHRTSRQVLEEILRQARRLVPYTAANLVLLEGETLTVQGSHGYEALGLKEYIDRLAQPLDDFPVDQAVVQTGRSLVVPDTREDPRWVFLEQMAWIRSFLSVPLCVEGRVLGMLRLDADRPGQFDETAAARLEPLANLAAIALERARLHERTQQELAERQRAQTSLAGQNRVLRLISTGRPLSEALEALIELIESQCKGMIGSILLLDEDGVHLRHGAAPRLPEAYNRKIDGIEIGPQVGSCGTAAFRGERVVVSDIKTDPLWEGYRELALAHELRACWSVPIFSPDHKVLGTFALYYHEPRSPTAEEIRCIEEASHLAGIALERARIERHERKLKKRLEQSAIQTATALARLIEAKDHYTGEHCERIARQAVALGRRLGLSKPQLEQLRYAALLHDLGKIGVPEEVLHKPGKLTAHEWDQLKAHVRIGEELVRGIHPLRHAARIIAQHHERWDGSGYPKGLKGEDILLEARVLAVVDAYDAMTSERSYHPAFPPEQARAELRRLAGAWWDPQVVEAFLALLDEV